MYSSMLLAFSLSLVTPQGIETPEDPWPVSMVFQLGSDEDPLMPFPSPTAIVLHPSGDAFVLHPMERSLRILGETGVVKTVVGGRGQGPGEFERPAWMGVNGNSVWVFDPGTNRFTLLDSLGGVTWSRSASLSIPDGGGVRYWPFSLLADWSHLSTQRVPSQMIAEGIVKQVPFVKQRSLRQGT